jgi:hypothetical protein
MDLHTILVTLHLIGFAFGVGGATVSDVVFLKSIKNGTVSKDQFELIKTVSTVVWASVVLLLVTGTTLMALQQYEIGEVPRFGWSFFQLKLVAFFAAVLNGIVFHFLVFPSIKKSVGKSFRTKQMKRKYPLFAFTGGVSVVSWYTAFLMVALGSFFIQFPFSWLLGGYLAAVVGAAIGAYSVIWMYGNDYGDIVDRGKNLIIRLTLLAFLFFFLIALYILFFT